MLRALLSALLLTTPTLAIAQTAHTTTNEHEMNHSDTDHTMQGNGPMGALVTEPGQGAFAAIAEIVATLSADPDTDWSVVNIGALREHLRDMNVVTIDSAVQVEPVEGGLKFIVTGPQNVSPSIQRMIIAHAGIMNGVDEWDYSAAPLADGASLTVIVPQTDFAKLSALGFYGLMASGMHHQTHHWMMATGKNPHN